MTVVLGFAFGLGVKVYVQLVPSHPAWIDPYANQATINWLFCVAVCIAVSLATAPPRPEQITDQTTVNWRKLNIFGDLGRHWYSSVVLWWALFVVAILALVVLLRALLPGGRGGLIRQAGFHEHQSPGAATLKFTHIFAIIIGCGTDCRKST